MGDVVRVSDDSVSEYILRIVPRFEISKRNIMKPRNISPLFPKDIDIHSNISLPLHFLKK